MGNKSLKTSKTLRSEVSQHSNGFQNFFLESNPKKRRSEPSLFGAIDQNDCNRIRQLIESGHRINKRDANGLTALHLAAINGNEECVKLLLQFNAQLICCPLRQTPLHFAAINGTKNMIIDLIEYGSVINVKDSMGSTPLASAVDANNEETVAALLLKRAVLHPSVCVSALQKGFSDILRLLLNSRPNIIESIDLKDFCFTRITVCGLKILYFSGFPFDKTLINRIQPLNWSDFCLSGRIRLPPEHYNRDLDFKEFELFIEWIDNRSEPKSLKCLSRIAFRKCCNQNNLEIILNDLNVPKVLRNYLLLKDI